MYVICMRHYNAERSRQKQTTGKRKGKGGKANRAGETVGGEGSGRRWNVSYADAVWGKGKGKGK